jgi:hypothetical protein
MKANGWFRWVAFAVSAGFFWTIAVSVSPGLHERIHTDLTRGNHSCAVTFVRGGNCHHVATPPFSAPVDLVEQFARLSELSPCWVASPLSAAIFEHAPPFAS